MRQSLAPAVSLHAVRLQPAPLPAGRGRETHFDPSWAVRLGTVLEPGRGRVRARLGVVQGGHSPGVAQLQLLPGPSLMLCPF